MGSALSRPSRALRHPPLLVRDFKLKPPLYQRLEQQEAFQNPQQKQKEQRERSDYHETLLGVPLSVTVPICFSCVNQKRLWLPESQSDSCFRPAIPRLNGCGSVGENDARLHFSEERGPFNQRVCDPRSWYSGFGSAMEAQRRC